MVFSALDLLADPAVHEIPRRGGDGEPVNHRDQDKGQLDVDGVQESRQQGTDDAAEGFGRVVEAHDQILLSGVCPRGHHVLQNGDADGIPGVQRDAAGEENGNLRREDSPQRGRVQTATSTTVDLPVLALRMIHRHSVMLNRKEMKPTTALMMPL